MNVNIRTDIFNMLKANGKMKTRSVITILAKKYSTPKQRISGNISYMVSKLGNIEVERKYQNSEIFIP